MCVCKFTKINVFLAVYDAKFEYIMIRFCCNNLHNSQVCMQHFSLVRHARIVLDLNWTDSLNTMLDLNPRIV